MSISHRKRRTRRRAAWVSLAVAVAASALCPPAMADVTPWGVESLLQIDINYRDIRAARTSWQRAQQVADRMAVDEPDRSSMRISPVSTGQKRVLPVQSLR